MNNHERFRGILQKVFNNKGYVVYSDNYPDKLEDDIQRDVYQKEL